MLKFLIFFFLIYLLAVVLAILALAIFPFFTIIHCANSVMTKAKKTAWILLMLIAGPIASVAYGAIVPSQSGRFRKFSFGVLILFAPIFLIFLFDMTKIIGELNRYPRFRTVLASLSLEPQTRASEKSAFDYVLQGIPKATVQEDQNGAIEDFSKAISIDPKYVAAYVHRAECYAKLGQTSLSQKDATRAMSLI